MFILVKLKTDFWQLHLGHKKTGDILLYSGSIRN